MKNFKFYLAFICVTLVLLPLQAQKINFDKGREFSDKMLAPNAKLLTPAPAKQQKQQGSLLRSLRAAGQPESLDLGDGLHLLPDDLDPESSVISATITSDQWANLPAIWSDLMVSISNRIYEKFNDDFDFLFFSLDRVSGDYADSLGFYGINLGISNDVTGLGLDTFSYASAWGSGGKLKSAMFFPSTQMILAGPSLHELCHNWAAYICSINASGSPSSDFGGHWGVSNAGGQLGGFKYVRVVEENSGGVPGKTLYQASMSPDTNPDGSFIQPWDGYGGNTVANGGNSVPYSDIELYLMGMKSAQELRDADFHLDIYSGIDYDLDGNFSSAKGYFYSTAKTSYTIDDIIAFNGERIPDAATSQKQFKVLTVIITEEDSIPRFAYNMISGLQWFSGYPGCAPGMFVRNFSEATNGIGSLITTDVKNSLKSFVGADVSGVSLDMTTVSLPVNTSQRLTATILPNNARNKNVRWNSSDESVATVSATGLITAVGEGKATITVTTEDGGFSATCAVTVTPALADFEVNDGVLVAYHGTGGDIIIPDNLGITKIGSYTFFQNTTITSVSIPEGITQILDNAFAGCLNLRSIIIPNSVEMIEDGAFANCIKLTSITIPKSVTSIGGNDVFLACYWLASISVDTENPAYSSEDGVLYNKDKTILYIYPVGKGETAFNIPNSVKSIGDYAFEYCQKLTSITIPNSVETIGNNAFSVCANLTAITIPNSVKSIGDYAFGNCSELTSIVISGSVETIGSGAFGGCMKLASIDVDAENSVYSSEDGILYNKEKTILYKYPPAKGGTVFDIPNTVKTIGDVAFGSCYNLTSITIPNSVTEIGMQAFQGCMFTSITIPYSVTEIGLAAFESCLELRDIAVHWKTPPTVSEPLVFGGLFNLYAIILHVPYGTKALYEAADIWKTFGAIVEQEPLSATGVSLDETSLSLVAGNTEQLTATLFPEDAYSNQSWSSSNPDVSTVSDNGLVTAQAAGTATITVTTQDGNFTATCVITVINGVSIGLFSGGSVSADKAAPTAGETVTLTISPDAGYELDTISVYKVGDETTAVETLHATSLNTYEFVMPEYGVTVTAIFRNLPDFEVIDGVLVAYHGTGGDIVIPANLGITKIGVTAFYQNYTITSVSIPEGVTQILGFAFYQCANLTSIIIPNSVETIVDGAFEFCSTLTSITIPSSVTSIGNNVFLGCNLRDSIHVDAENPAYSSEDGILYNKDKTTLYIYPMGKGEITFDIPNTVILVSNYAFYNCHNLTSITIPNSVTSIGYDVFQYCDELRHIDVHWKTPPTITESTLGGLNLSAITLHVPYGTKALYEAADVWKEFGAIVEQEPVSVAGVSLDKTTLSLYTGNTAQLTATVIPEDAADSNLSWSSSDHSVATVSDNGLVTAQAAGTATITVTTQDGNFTETCEITIIAPAFGVSVGSFSGGSISADKTAATAGETVTLTISPDADYELDAISAYKVGDETTAVETLHATSLNTYEFTMPEYGVTVTATFRNPNAEAVATAKSLIEGINGIAIAQAAANTETAVKSWLATQINALAGMSATGITVSATNITISGFNAAAEGTTGMPAGSDGSFNFTVSLTKGSSNSTTTSKVGTITATAYVYQNYTVTIAATTNGSVSVSPGTSIKETETAILTILPDASYELDAISAYKTGEPTTIVTLSGNTFTMPAFDVTVTATFKKSQETLDSEALITAMTAIESSSYNVDQATANTETDAKAWLTTQINDMIASTGITVTTADITFYGFTAAAGGVNGGFYFTVAIAKDSFTAISATKSGIISATPVYIVTVSTATNGNVLADKTATAAGETVTLTVTPAAGYELDAISACKTGEPTTVVEMLSATSFTMPEYDVTVSATFKKTQEQLDKEAIETAKAAIEGGDYKIAQATGNMVTDVKTWLVNTLNRLFGQLYGIELRSTASIVGDVTITALTPAVAGMKTNPEGTNGSFLFTVTLAKGETSLVTGDIPGVIMATPYTEIPVKSIELMKIGDLTVHIINTGNVATGNLSLVLSGANADVFTLSSSTVNDLTVGEEADITLTPHAELANGTYTATLTVNGDGLESKSIEITYNVTNVGNENISLKPLKVWIQNAMLHVSGLTAGKSWRVSNVSGVLVYQGIANSEQADISLFVRGVYFVQSGNRIVKVLY